MAEAFTLIKQHETLAYFVGAQPSELIERAENVLGCKFPLDYLEFVSQLGAGAFGSFEIYGLINSDFEHSAVPNAVWLTLDERRGSKLPNNLLIIGDTGYGNYYVLQISANDSAVFEYDPSYSALGDKRYTSFSEFFSSGIKAALVREGLGR
jgi:hypothetical protein